MRVFLEFIRVLANMHWDDEPFTEKYAGLEPVDKESRLGANIQGSREGIISKLAVLTLRIRKSCAMHNNIHIISCAEDRA